MLRIVLQTDEGFFYVGPLNCAWEVQNSLSYFIFLGNFAHLCGRHPKITEDPIILSVMIDKRWIA